MKRIFISLAVLTALLAPILLKTQTSYAVDINNGTAILPLYAMALLIVLIVVIRAIRPIEYTVKTA